VKPLSCEEEQMMRRFYEQKIQEVCKAFKFPHKIQVKHSSSNIQCLCSLNDCVLTVSCCFAGYGNNIFQEILSTVVCNGASPKAYYVSNNGKMNTFVVRNTQNPGVSILS
jgi:hypothetical protein